LKIKQGYDPDYYFRQMSQRGRAAKGLARGPEYYLSAAEQGGEPPGHWVGEGLADLGIHDDDVVDRDDYLSLYGGFTNPRDGYTLGAPPRDPAAVQKIFEEKKAGRPGLTRDEERQLYAEARAEAPAPVLYWDSVFSVDKTISLAHATAVAEVHRARQAGDVREAAAWQARADAIEAEIGHSTRTAVAWMQRELSFVRRGYHGRRVEGVESGRFEDSQTPPVATFLQHTSRDGDPHLHVHVTWLNRVKSASDGAWLGLDSRALHRIRGAAASIHALALESGLAARVGLGPWKYRPASKGRVLAAVPDAAINAFSSRRAEIGAVTDGMVAQYRAERGHDPTRRALWSMRAIAARETRKGKPEGALDYAQLLREWERISRAHEMGTLHSLAQVIWHGARPGSERAEEAALGGPEPLMPDQERNAMVAGLAALSAQQATFTTPDLMWAIEQQLPDHARSEDSVARLEDLAARALAGGAGEDVVCLTPAWPPVPEGLTRESDGGSIYRPHGAERYATARQLADEERMVAEAQAQGAPKLERTLAAQLLGTDAQTIEAYMREGCPYSPARTATGLRMDQAVTGYLALTSGDRVDLVVGPAGTGKTRLMAALAEAWRAAGKGAVIGLATTSAVRNNLEDASEHIKGYNTAQFLGHDPEAGREARGTAAIGPEALILLDEATMTSQPDIAATIRAAKLQGAKIFMAADHGQLEAVEAGGGFAMLARRKAHAQLTKAQRLIHDSELDAEWEADASLALRAGGRGAVEALCAYDDHGRLRGGTYERMADLAVQHYLAEHLARRDVLLTAYENAECRDLSRRAQEQLIRWGKLAGGQSVPLQEGERAHAGDLIIARENTTIPAGGPGASALVNSDMLRLEEISPNGQHVTVRRFNRDKDGRPAGLGEPFTLHRSYLAEHADLGYARTWHTVEGMTVDVGISLASDARPLSGFYPSLTRGRRANYGYAYGAQGRAAEGDAPQGAPEVERHRRLQAEAQAGAQRVGVDEMDALAILAKVVHRNTPKLSATESKERAESAADHLGALQPMWLDQVRQESAKRFWAAAQEALPAHQAEAVLRDDPDDLWRSLRAAELHGKDGATVLREAIALGSLDDARSVPAVLASRVRGLTEHLPTARADTWEARAPVTGDPEHDRWFREVIGRAMDDRQRRLGEHYAAHPPVWARQALGEVPAEEDARAGWERAAGKAAAYREITGWDHEGDAIGPRPGTANPEARAAWDEAVAVMPKVDGVDLRGLTDGQLQARQVAFERETAWAPKYVLPELRMARRAGVESRVQAHRRRLDAEAAAAKDDQGAAGCYQEAAEQYEAMGRLADRQVGQLESAHDTWKQWNVMAEPTRRIGKAAAAEQQRRNGDAEPLRSAEPEGITKQAEADSQAGQDEATAQALNLTPDTDSAMPEAVDEAMKYNREKQDEIDERASEQVPDEDPDYEDMGPAWQTLVQRERDAVIQPPKPIVPASDQVAERASEHEEEPEAG
jgi:hypothetical protein